MRRGSRIIRGHSIDYSIGPGRKEVHSKKKDDKRNGKDKVGRAMNRVQIMSCEIHHQFSQIMSKIEMDTEHLCYLAIFYECFVGLSFSELQAAH